MIRTRDIVVRATLRTAPTGGVGTAFDTNVCGGRGQCHDYALLCVWPASM